MALKPRTKRKIFLWGAIVVAIIGLAILQLPTMMNLNTLKPRIEQAIAAQTGTDVKIRGDVNFSLLGRATIVAHDIETPNGEISAAMFAVPLTQIFDLENAKLAGDVKIYGGQIKIDKIKPAPVSTDISIYNLDILFQNRKFNIVNARVRDGQWRGIVRTDQHKYSVWFSGDTFTITNANNRFKLHGQLFANGDARGTIFVETDQINDLFQFEQLKIDKPVQVTADFKWDGEHEIKLSNIKSDNFQGDIELGPDGVKTVRLKSDNVTRDFSFLLSPGQSFRNTNLDLKMAGKLQFAGRDMARLDINAITTPGALHITKIVADDVAITGGYIDQDGAHNIMITAPLNNNQTICLFSGTPEKWECTQFSYGDMFGTISVDGDSFVMSVQSDGTMPEYSVLTNLTQKIAQSGKIYFRFSDIGGTVEINEKNIVTRAKYDFANNKTPAEIMPELKFLPKFIANAQGNLKTENGVMIFQPYNNKWELSVSGVEFRITGRNFKDWVSDVDLRALRDIPYVVSGTFHNNNISNLNISVAGHDFTGNVVGKKITLHSDFLDIDSFISQDFTDNYAEIEFLSPAPIMLPFWIGAEVSLSADKLIYNGQEYENFTYSLKPDIQTFSVTDKSRGAVLATINKQANTYEIFAQLRNFQYTGPLPWENMPLALQNTIITGEITMKTSGIIAHDIVYNLGGEIDITFEGGDIIGIGIDEFYANANNIGMLNAEYALSTALDGGISKLKTLRIRGQYKNGNFTTTQPFELQMRHTTATGDISITSGQMRADIELTMRGTSPTPTPVSIRIWPDNARQYSLTAIMNGFDPSFMRKFLETHTQF